MFDFISKMRYYPEKTKAFLEGRYSDTLTTVMLYLASDMCNHDCTYCDKNFYQFSQKEFDMPFLNNLIDDMLFMGADSLIILGEGAEPLLCKELCQLIDKATDNGIHCGIYTNGSLVNSKIVNAFNRLDFVRVSLDAGNIRTHSIIHQYDITKHQYFENAIDLLRSIDKSTVETGISYIVLKDNVNEIYDTWKLMNEIGVGYIEIKLPLEKGYVFDKKGETQLQYLKEQLSKIERENNSGTRVVLNKHIEMLINGTCGELDKLTKQDTLPCYTSVFRTIVSPLGYFLCSPKKNTDENKYGDPFKQSLLEAWNSERHKKMIGCDCSIRCIYSQQNKTLISLRQGVKATSSKVKYDSQIHFL